MIQIISGEKGEGKSKHLIDMANKSKRNSWPYRISKQ